MKPLELTIYPDAECICELSSEYATGYNYACDVADHGWMQSVTKAKRLTDAELAAEVNYAVFHESECELRARKLGEGHPHYEHYRAGNHEWARRAPILERFAKLPHYDEDDQ